MARGKIEMCEYEAEMQRQRRTASVNNLQASEQILIMPSPTSADYLRNRTRECAAMNPQHLQKQPEISQILYDDMAYRQLRKDSDAIRPPIAPVAKSRDYYSAAGGNKTV